MKSIQLRRARSDDAESLCKLFEHESVLAGTLHLPFASIDKWRDRLAAQTTDILLVAEMADQFVGYAGLHLEPARRRIHAASVSIAVHGLCHNQGIGTMLMGGVLDMADNFLQLSRLELSVFADNAPAVALYQKFGFIKEGYMRAHAMRQGQLCDGLSMARLKLSERLDARAAPGPHINLIPLATDHRVQDD